MEFCASAVLPFADADSVEGEVLDTRTRIARIQRSARRAAGRVTRRAGAWNNLRPLFDDCAEDLGDPLVCEICFRDIARPQEEGGRGTRKLSRSQGQNDLLASGDTSRPYSSQNFIVPRSPERYTRELFHCTNQEISEAANGVASSGRHGIFCRGCVAQHLKTRIFDARVTSDALKCPDPRCTHIFARAELATLVPHAVMLKYDRFVTALDSNFVFCPAPGCNAMAQKRDLTCGGRRLDCKVCGRASCITCAREWHALPTCALRSNVLPLSVQYSAWREDQDIKRCPKCSYLIQKNGGCSHMTCRRCTHEFHWCCKQDYRGNHNPALCPVLSFVHTNHRAFGPTTPLRLVTKTAAVPAMAAAGMVAAAAAVVYATGWGLGRVGYAILCKNPVATWHRRRRQLEREAAFRRRMQELRAQRRAQAEAERLMSRIGAPTPCPVAGCNQWFTFHETLERHLIDRHAQDQERNIVKATAGNQRLLETLTVRTAATTLGTSGVCSIATNTAAAGVAQFAKVGASANMDKEISASDSAPICKGKRPVHFGGTPNAAGVGCNSFAVETAIIMAAEGSNIGVESPADPSGFADSDRLMKES